METFFSVNMKNIFFVLGFLFVASKAMKPNKVSTFNSNHVNLSLETAFIFDPKDAYYDISLIKTLRDFLQSLETQISNRTQLRSQAVKHFKVSDFVYELGRYLLSYNDENLHTFLVVLQDVVEDYYPTETFKKLFYDPRLRSFVKNSLKSWINANPRDLKIAVRVMYGMPTYNETFTNFIFSLNDLFSKSDEARLQKLVHKFAKFPKKQQKLKRSIENSLNYIIFDRYRMLTFNQTTKLIQELSNVANYVGLAFPEMAMVPDDTFKMAGTAKRVAENITVFESLVNDKKPVMHLFPPRLEKFSGSYGDDMPLNTKDSFEAITNDKEDVTRENEIVINKAVKFDVNRDSQRVNDVSNEIVARREMTEENSDSESDF